jgi:translocation and assembly module TamB
VLNVFPVYLEAQNIRVFDEEGGAFASSERIKVYPRLSALFEGRIDIQRVVLMRPGIDGTVEEVESIVSRVRERDREEGEPEPAFELDIKTIAVREATVSLVVVKSGESFSAREFNADIALKEEPEVDFSAEDVRVDKEGVPFVSLDLEGRVVVDGETIIVREMVASGPGSEISAEGSLSVSGHGELSLKASLAGKMLKEILKFDRSDKGLVEAEGMLAFAGDFLHPTLDVEVGGEFFLQTLMEAVGESDEDLSGYIRVAGWLRGKVPDVQAEVRASMTEGVIYGVEVDELRCRIAYQNNKLDFQEGEAVLYGGEADVEASIGLPEVEPYSVDVSFLNVESNPVFTLIEAEELHSMPGRLSGELHTSGMNFAPSGRVVFRGDMKGEGPLSRIQTISGLYALSGSDLSLTDFNIQTALSRLSLHGHIDTTKNALNLEGGVTTSDVKDLLTPYTDAVSGRGAFSGSVSGTFDNPRLEGMLRLEDTSVSGYRFGNTVAEIIYTQRLLTIVSARAEDSSYGTHSVKGSVRFVSPEGVSVLENPVYDLSLSASGGSLSQLLGSLNIENVPLEGTFGADVVLSGEGTLPHVAGRGKVIGGSFYGRPVEEALLSFAYADEQLTLSDSVMRQGDSVLSLKGNVHRNGSFEFSASSEQLLISSLLPKAADVPLEYALSLKSSGRGSFDNPEIDVDIVLSDGTLKGISMGTGRIVLSLSGNEATFAAKAVNDEVSISGRALLTKDMPWKAKVSFAHARYDFLLGALLKEIPEDLMLTLKGEVELEGTKSSLSASAVLRNLHMNLYGQGFSNVRDVVFSVSDRELSFSDIEMRSGSAYLKIDGSMDVGVSYDITFEGSSSLVPLSGFLDDVDSLQGSAEFVFSLAGDWEHPELNGGLSISEGMIELKEYPQRVTSANLFAYIDEDKVVVREVRASVGGGTLEAAGAVYLDGMKVDWYLLNAFLENVSLVGIEGISMNLGGEMVFKGSASAHAINGELEVKRAIYSKRIEWKSWLIKGRKRPLKTDRAWGQKVRLNIRLYGSDHILIDNNIARAPLNVDVVARGTVAAPFLSGRLEANRGKVFFRNSEFRVISATADFIDPDSNKPTIRIIAEASLKGYLVTLSMDGKIDQFDLTLASDPPLDELEILTLLTLGEFGSGDKGLEGGEVGAAEATAFLTGQFQDVLEERFAALGGFDRFSVDPHVSRSTGQVVPRITVSKRLLEDKLFVTYSSSVGTDSEQEVKLEYLLRSNVSLVGGQDDRGSIGGDVKFRFQFR